MTRGGKKILVGICGGIIAICVILRMFVMPPLMADVPFSNAYYDRNGELLRLTLAADDKYRLYTPLSEIAPALRNATVLYEDRWFFFHPGINPISLIGATINYFTHHTRPIGASTITMQVARMKYDLDTTQPGGKFIQIIAALYIDLFYSKNDILEAYLNMAPYGGNIVGIGAAARIYFDRNAADLSQIESITLSTIPQNPTRRGLHSPNGLAHVRQMRQDLVRRWIKRYPNDTELLTMADMDLDVRSRQELPFAAPHMIDRLIQQAQHNAAPIPQSGIIHTTIDAELNRRLNNALTREIARRRSSGVENAAVLLINYRTMETHAYIGSADYFDKSIYGENDGVYARRSPGSTLKPLIYAMAIDQGLIHSMTLLRDARINFGVYAPENSDSEFYGPVLAKDALNHSRNIPAIDLVRRGGIRHFYQLLRDVGISHLRPVEHYGVSMALGGAEVSMAELAKIYATIANLGRVQQIRMRQDTPSQDGPQLLSAEAFFLTLDMMRHAPSGSTRIAYARTSDTPIDHYWKTGTSSSYRDAWTAGIFGDYVLVVWVGNFDGRPNNAFSGAKTAAPIYFRMADVVRDYDAARGHPIQNPDFLRDGLNVTKIDMCDDVGGIAGAYCPKKIAAYFIPGTSPIDISPVYRAIPIDRSSGLRACRPDPDTTQMKVYEFWDAEYLDMFRRAGITRHTPPAFIPGCDLDTISDATTPPVITSPVDRTRIIITDETDNAMVSMSAVTTSMDKTLFWFLDNALVGTSSSGETITYHTPIGEHNLRVVDSTGTATKINFSVAK